jgi:hypothetical protein
MSDTGRQGDPFPLRERIRFRDNLGLALRDVRQRPAFAALERGPWFAFIAIACYWQSNAEAWPSQETIATFSGYSARAVRDYVEELERAGVVRLRRERRPTGAERIYYAPGPVTLAELAAFVERFPSRPAPMPVSHPPETSSGAPPTPPEVASGGPPETSSMEPRDQDLEPSSCPSGERGGPPAPAEEEKPRITREDREIARTALAERMKRKRPKRPPPRWFDRAEVEMVAECTAAVDGDREAKLRAHRDAIDGAFQASKDGPPTARFIWGKLEHFLEHTERGERRARAEERAAQRRAEEDRQTTVRRTGAAATRGSPPSRDELAKARAEFEELAASAAPPFRAPLEAMAARYRELERKAE